MPREMEKDPNAVKDFFIDWSQWLTTGDSLSVSTWTVPAGITKDSDTISGSKTVIWLSGGTVDQDYELVNHITTAQGREEDATITIACRQT